MKKIISLSLCMAVMLLCACTQVVKSPQIKTSFSQKATITIGDYSYTANVKFDGSKVYIMVSLILLCFTIRIISDVIKSKKPSA